LLVPEPEFGLFEATVPAIAEIIKIETTIIPIVINI